MLKGFAAAGVLAALLGCAATTHAGTVIRVKDGRAHSVKDRFLPARHKTALPAVPGRTKLIAPAPLARVAALPPRSSRSTTPRSRPRGPSATRCRPARPPTSSRA